MAADDLDGQFPVAGASAETIGLLAGSLASPPPSSLRARVLGAASARAHPERMNPVEAYFRSVESLATLLDELTVADHRSTVEPYGWSVRGLIAHLAAVELYFGATLGLWEHVGAPGDADENDHVAFTQHSVDAAVADDSDLTAEWSATSAAIIAVLRSANADTLKRTIRFNVLNTRASTVLIARVFELWTHEEDIRRATGRPLVTPEPERLAAMAAMAVPAIPLGLLLNGGGGAGRTLRVVLTGAGGRTWVQPLGFGETAGEPSATLVADIADFCRYAAQRIPLGEFEHESIGDHATVALGLQGAAVFAA